MTLTPAYGRDYKSKKAVLADWNAGKDFLAVDMGPWDGKPINKEQVPAGTSLTFRYSAMRKVFVEQA